MAVALCPGRADLDCHMGNEQVREFVVRRVRLREDLKPIKACWHQGPVQPDWLFITRVTDREGHESFDVQSVKVWPTACKTQPAAAGLIGYMCYETLRIAKDQAHADVGVEYVEWEPCNIEITNPDGSVDWTRALPCAETGACT